ncbi:MAG: hypothetical protein IJ228_12125 [Succinivibrio sp.]|nr:hypothetical protein [Succinivibrio sp.]
MDKSVSQRRLDDTLPEDLQALRRATGSDITAYFDFHQHYHLQESKERYALLKGSSGKKGSAPERAGGEW